MGDIQKISTSKDLGSKYDNTEFSQEQRARDIASAYGNLDLAKAETFYIECLLKRHEALSKGNIKSYDKDGKVVDVNIGDLLPKPSEFELIRLQVIKKINGMDKAELRQAYLRFETDSSMELSEKITNFIIDQRRKKEVFDDFNVFA